MDQNNQITLFSDLKSEITVDENGKGFISRRGIARLCGVQEPAIRYWLERIKNQNNENSEFEGAKQKLPKMFESFLGEDFEGAKQLPDTLASAFLNYYAFQGFEVAQNYLLALGAIALRSMAQQINVFDNRSYDEVYSECWQAMSRFEFALAYKFPHYADWQYPDRPQIYLDETYYLMIAVFPCDIHDRIVLMCKNNHLKGWLDEILPRLEFEDLVRILPIMKSVNSQILNTFHRPMLNDNHR